MRVLVGGSEIRSSCTSCDGWMFRVVGIAAVNGPRLMSTFFSREDIYASRMHLRFTAFQSLRRNKRHILEYCLKNVLSDSEQKV